MNEQEETKLEASLSFLATMLRGVESAPAGVLPNFVCNWISNIKSDMRELDPQARVADSIAMTNFGIDLFREIQYIYNGYPPNDVLIQVRVIVYNFYKKLKEGHKEEAKKDECKRKGV